MRNRKLKTVLLSTIASLAIVAAATSTGPVIAGQNDNGKAAKKDPTNPNNLPTKTPIKHIVVVFNENSSFDHYFGTYPRALNPEGEPAFVAAENTPRDINNLLSAPALLTDNPNRNPANRTGATNPFRLDRTQANTADQSHGYTSEQKAYDAGKNDLFPLNVGKGTTGGAGAFGNTGQVMGYFDGNTVTAFWNYAQNFAMSDNAWGDNFGPSTPGMFNMFAGTTNGVTPVVVPAGFPTTQPELGLLLLSLGAAVPNSDNSLTLVGDIDPAGDVCSNPTAQIRMTSKNIGDLLNVANVPWGSFMGGFNLGITNKNGSTGCRRSSVGQVTSSSHTDYIPHHIWFQYYASTANPTHARPTSVAAIGHTLVPGSSTVDPANHGYDLNDFFTAVQAGNYPAVSFIKMAAFQDGHPGNSNPLDEQAGLVNLVNFLQQQPDWDSTAVVVTYDDSDGWYDHISAQITHGSFSPADALNGAGNCGIPGSTPVPNGVSGQPVGGRCGPGTRHPFVVISPYAKQNYVSHVLISQASIPRFIEDNWLNSARIGGGSFDATAGSIMDMFDFDRKNNIKLMLDPTFGTVKDKSKNAS
jgi:phospholipase C